MVHDKMFPSGKKPANGDVEQLEVVPFKERVIHAARRFVCLMGSWFPVSQRSAGPEISPDIAVRLIGTPWKDSPTINLLFRGKEKHIHHVNEVFFDGHAQAQTPMPIDPSVADLPIEFKSVPFQIVVRETTSCCTKDANTAFRIPPYIEVEIPVDSTMVDPLAIVPRSMKTRLKQTLTAGVLPTLSKSLLDYDHFYEQLHKPMVTTRHHENMLLRRLEEIRPKGNHWTLLFAEFEGKRVAGMELHFSRFSQGTVRCVRSGFSAEVLSDPKQYAQYTTFLYAHACLEAASRGHRVLNVGLTPSSLGHGVLVFKARWKGVIRMPCDSVRWDVGFPLGDATQFLAHHPLIAEEDGRLIGLAARHGDFTPAAILSEHQHSGLHEIRMVSVPNKEPH